MNEAELARLAAHWDGPRLELPLLPLDRRPGTGGGLGGCPGRGGPVSGDLLGRHLTVVVGGGGVGKTTLAAALALGSAREGRRTLVMTIDPSLRLKDALGVGEEAKDEPVRVMEAGPGFLDAALLDAKRTFDRLIRTYAPDPTAAKRIFANRVLPGHGRQPFGNPGIHGHGTPVRDAGLRPV